MINSINSTWRPQRLLYTYSTPRNGYQKQFEDSRNNGQEPKAPAIPSEIIQKMTERYVAAYERTTGSSL